MKILYLDDALSDLEWFYYYYSHVFYEGASNALLEFDITEGNLSANPFIWREVDGGARKLHINRTPFSYIYRVTDDYIEVIRVWDNRRGSNLDI